MKTLPLEQIVRRANVVYTLDSFQTGIPHVPPFLSNGVLGGCFDLHGFMSRPNTGNPEGRHVLGYIGQYHRRKVGQHMQFPLAILRARFADGTDLNLVDTRGYRQELDLLTATLTTAYDLYGSMHVEAFFPIHAPNLFVLRVTSAAEQPGRELAVEFECDTSASQNNHERSREVPPVELDFKAIPGGVEIHGRTNTVDNRWIIHAPGAAAAVEGSRARFHFAPGTHTLKVWVAHRGGVEPEALGQSYETLHAAHTAEWRRFWETSWIDFPAPIAHAVWTRTKYYCGSLFPVLPEKPICPEGVLSNTFSFPFPQDVYYVAENLPRLGHFDRAVNALQWWLDVLPEVRAYGKRLMGVEGAYYPWTPPFKDWNRFEVDAVTTPDSYELHNPAYVLAMVWHAYLFTQDLALLRRFFPVIEGVFEFYANIASLSPAGTYDLYHRYARGQDENSSADGQLRNLLCCGFSAGYSTRVYRTAAGLTGQADPRLLARAAAMAAAGFTRDTLLRPEGYYRTYEGDDRPPGRQKHPVQLNPIAYLPMPDLAGEGSPTETAWLQRYDLTERARRPHTAGWTLGEFILASVRMGAPAEALKDLRAIQPCRGADARWVQFYESSFIEGWHLHAAYYFTMSGLYLQAFTETVVQDWRGYLDLFACLFPGWEEQELAFHGLRGRGGAAVSGWWNRGTFEVTVVPGAARSQRLRVARPGLAVSARGQATGPASFAGGEVVEFAFEPGVPLVLNGSLLF